MKSRPLRLAAFLLSSPMLAGIVILNAPGARAQAPNRTPRAQRPVPASSASEITGLKGILEPVNYGQDVKLTDVFFTSVDEGWVSGEHATILHTVDGGKTWTAQVGGDANNDEKPIDQLRFLDQKRGWAVQDGHRLMRTLDGQNWEQISANLSPVIDYAFLSVRRGVLLEGNTGGFSVTDDGGRHWRVVAPCQFTASVQGLAQKTDCHFIKLQMISPRSGLALAMGNADHWLAVFRTNDAGEHWSSVAADVEDCCTIFAPPSAFFLDANHGVLVFGNRKTYLTADGGTSWHVLLSGGVGVDNGKLRFTDPQIGWTIGDNYRDLVKVSYTTDAGQHWNLSAPIKVPADQVKELTFSFPRRDRAYIVGPHGMVYRYSLVLAGYVSSISSPGPLMPSFDSLEITTAASRIRQDIATLQTQIAAASGGVTSPSAMPGSGTSMASSAATANPANGGFTQNTGTAGTSVPQTQIAAPDASAAAGFTQDTGAAAAFSSDPTNTNLTQGFTQSVDTSAPSAPLQSCCAPALQSLQTNLTGFNQVAATNSTQFRSLNLIIAGVQLVTNLLNQTQQLRTSFAALKRAPTLQAASGILQQLSTTMNSTQQTVSMGFQNPGTWYATPSPVGGFVQDTSMPPNP